MLSGGLVLPPHRRMTPQEQGALELPNPDHAQWKMLRRKFKRMPEPPKKLPCWRALPGPHPWIGTSVLPRYAPAPEGVQELDRTVAPLAPELTMKVTLRDYQEAAVQAWLRAGRVGVVQAPCGAGKTVMGLAAIADTPTPALILVHTLDLARQWADRCRTQLGLEATMVGGGSREAPGRVTIATFQTLATWDWWDRQRWGARFGLVVVDEAHHVPAETFSEVMLTMPARYRLGLSATPKRPDGLSDLLWWHLGDLLVELELKDLVSEGRLVAPDVHFVPTGWELPEDEDWNALLAAASDSPSRNRLILGWLDQLVEDRRQVLVLVKHVDHAGRLAAWATEHGHRAAAFTGKLPKKARAEVLAQAAQGDLDILVATTVADEGLDLPTLSAAVLTMPSKPGGRLNQRVGRIMRPGPDGRAPILVDLVDPGLEGLAHGRARLYRQLRARILTHPPTA